MLGSLTLGSILIILAGLLLATYGGWNLYRYRSYMYGTALFSTGVGTALCGVTNIFTDYSPAGRMFTRVGVMAFLCGVPLLAYYFWRSI